VQATLSSDRTRWEAPAAWRAGVQLCEMRVACRIPLLQVLKEFNAGGGSVSPYYLGFHNDKSVTCFITFKIAGSRSEKVGCQELSRGSPHVTMSGSSSKAGPD
jgi:hypothetical protein